MERVPVLVLGATGMVGQRLLTRLADHPWFEVAGVAASDRSAGRPLAEAARWVLEGEPWAGLGAMRVLRAVPEAVPRGVRLAISALPSAVAGPLEPELVRRGVSVVTNASAHRLAPGVPLVVPEVNAHHLEVLPRDRPVHLANPNCCVVPLALSLAPLHRAFGVEALTCATWQAISGAGYPGESAWDVLANVHPHPGDEEDKLAAEPPRILGEPDRPAGFVVSARCVRVPVADGHLVGVHVRLRGGPTPEQVAEAWEAYDPGIDLPSLPRRPLRPLPGRDRPQPRLDAGAAGGMAVSLGRLEPCPVMGIKYYALAHNTVRGAAGAALANAELLVARGFAS